ncbi:MAG: endonuclease III [Thermoprotei archaeon]|nr:MAG: endonuclease III [Thermoprotei archaeon]
MNKISWVKLLKVMEKEAKKRNAPVFEISNYIDGPFQYLIFAVLSSRTRDDQTLKAASNLFKKAKTPEDLARMSIEEIQKLIKGVGFYRIKAKRIKELAKIISERGIPDNFKDLIKLPSVGRKTANVVISNAFKKPAIAVDTHVHRISNRLGLVKTKKPEETENELKKIVPKEFWRKINKVFVGFGQTVCKPIKPLCKECPFKLYCPSSDFLPSPSQEPSTGSH